MAAAILEQLDNVEVSLDKGSNGVFNVSVDERIVFSKDELGISRVDDIKTEDVIKTIQEYKEAAIPGVPGTFG